MVPVEKDRIQEWLKLIGCTPKPIQDAQAVWHLEFCYPSKTQPPHTMHVVSPAANPAAAVIASAWIISAEFVALKNAMGFNTQRALLTSVVGLLILIFIQLTI